MVCDFCARGIEKTFNKDEFVRKVDVDLANGQVLIAYSADKLINQKEISELILANGQNVTGIEIIKI
jgi:cation transport ATPase